MRRRLLLPAALLAVGVVLDMAAPAAAHVEVTAPGAQGSAPATLRFSAAAEDPDSGITQLATRLPEGMPSDGVSLAAGPEGWTLTVTADGFVVGGEPLPVGVDAEYSVAVPALPAGDGELVFPTLLRYGDGREDAWIEPSTASVPGPAMPAPVLVRGVDGSPDRAGPTAEAATRPGEGGPTGAAWYAGFGVLAVLALSGGTWFWRRRAGGAA